MLLLSLKPRSPPPLPRSAKIVNAYFHHIVQRSYPILSCGVTQMVKHEKVEY